MSQEYLPDNRPFTLAAAFLEQHQPPLAKVQWETEASSRSIVAKVEPDRLRHWREEFYEFRKCVYRKFMREDLEAKVSKFLNAKSYFNADKGRVQGLRVTTSLARDVMKQLQWLGQVECEAMPTWLDGEDRPDPRHVVAFSNGLLNVEDWLNDPDVQLEPSTPMWFSESVLPRAYNPKAKCPQTLRFFRETLIEQEQVDLLQEWLGYLLTRETRFQKMLWLHGFGGAGKGTICRLMTELVGEDNTTTFNLYSLTERFTLSSFVGKTLAIDRDAHLGQNTDAQRVVGEVLSIAGEDDRNVDRKNKDLLANIRLGTRIVVATNSFPHLPDAGIALRRRGLILSFDRTFEGKEDPHLFEKLKLELPGLTTWALAGLRRLMERGKFEKTKTGEAMLDRMGRISSPIRSFVEDCCTVHEQKMDQDGKPIKLPREHKKSLYAAWNVWAKENGHKTMAMNTFCERLYETYVEIKPCRAWADGKRSQMIHGVRINAEMWNRISIPEPTTEEEEEAIRAVRV